MAFSPKTGEVFKEEHDVAPVWITDRMQYVPWGADDQMPYNGRTPAPLHCLRIMGIKTNRKVVGVGFDIVSLRTNILKTVP